MPSPSFHRDLPDLPAELDALLRQIPAGRVTTYGRLADALGTRSAARWVGERLVDHPHDASCICHRVIRSTGDVGLYIGGDVAEKVRRLQLEGVEVRDGRVDLGRSGFGEFRSSRPLARLIEFQERLPDAVRLTPFPGVPDLAAGLDVSYAGDRRGVAAYALVEMATGRLVWSTTIERPIGFPYIPGLLAYRELPLHLALLDRVRSAGRLAPLLLVDGHGLLHQRRAGIAVHLGVLADVPTIGVGKTLLVGRVNLDGLRPDEPRPIEHHGHVLGAAVKATPRSRPVFVSPGQHASVEDAARLAAALFHGHRLPEPLHQADALSRRTARASATEDC